MAVAVAVVTAVVLPTTMAVVRPRHRCCGTGSTRRRRGERREQRHLDRQPRQLSGHDRHYGRGRQRAPARRDPDDLLRRSADGSLDGFTTWTASGWINMSALPANSVSPLLMKLSAYVCAIGENSGCAGCYTANAAVFVSGGSGGMAWPLQTAPQANTWYHYACRYAGTTLTVFLNGAPSTS